MRSLLGLWRGWRDLGEGILNFDLESSHDILFIPVKPFLEMPSCTECGQQVSQQVKHCPECGGRIYTTLIPELVDRAQSDSVTAARLRKKSAIFNKRLAEKPIIDYLDDGEQPHYILASPKRGFEYTAGSDQRITPTGRYHAFLIATDDRIVVLAGRDDGDRSLTISYTDIQAVDYDSGITKIKLKLEMASTSAVFHATRENTYDIDELVTFIQDKISSTPDLRLRSPDIEEIFSEKKRAEDLPGGNLVHTTYQGDRVSLNAELSQDQSWACLFGQYGSEDESPVALIDSTGEIHYVMDLERPMDAAVANDGTVVLNDGLSRTGQDLGGKLYVFDRSGVPIVEHEFESNTRDCAITPDGAFASTATHNPDRSVYLIDVRMNEITTEYNSELNGPTQEFGHLDNDVVLYLHDTDGRYRAISLDGETVWKSDKLQREERISDLLETSKEKTVKEAIPLLEEAYELTNDEHKVKRIAKDLADARWNMANEIRNEQGDSDDWWAHLNEAKAYYMQIVSWRQGQKGIAKVQRKQAKYHLKQGNEDMALELFENIREIGEEHDIELLTESNKETIERLRGY